MGLVITVLGAGFLFIVAMLGLAEVIDKIRTRNWYKDINPDEERRLIGKLCRGYSFVWYGVGIIPIFIFVAIGVALIMDLSNGSTDSVVLAVSILTVSLVGIVFSIYQGLRIGRAKELVYLTNTSLILNLPERGIPLEDIKKVEALTVFKGKMLENTYGTLIVHTRLGTVRQRYVNDLVKATYTVRDHVKAITGNDIDMRVR